MEIKRLDKMSSQKKLQELPHLANVLGKNWLEAEYKKPIEQWSLITGWVSSINEYDWALGWLKDLDNALAFLKTHTKPVAWNKIIRKVRSHTDRANFKGTLSELAICVFLSHIGVPYTLEVQLLPEAKKNIDIQAVFDNQYPLNIEVQWLSPSDESERGAAIASAYDEGYPIDYGYEMRRIKQKVFDKITKFTNNDITFVALDCTTSPELGGVEFSPIDQVIRQSFNKGTLDIDTKIRNYVDAVVWFELQNGNSLMPVQRSLAINPKSPYHNNLSVLRFAESWRLQ